jgi:hypothetical protein
MLKDIRIDGRMQRVFVLKETSERILYIALKSLHRVDYDQLLDIDKTYPKDMLEGMRKTKLANGRNALAQYDAIIQVSVKNQPTGDISRIRKPDEAIISVEVKNALESSQTVVQQTQAATVTVEQPVRKKPGPKPKVQ